MNFLFPAALIGFPTGIGAIMESQMRRSREVLLRKQEEVEHLATIAERERISRDLHDLLGHTLSLIALKAELAGKLARRDADAAAREIKDIEETARKALSEVRSAVTGYRQAGFAYELDSARSSLAAANIALHAEVQPFALPPAAENVMSLALREAVTNIVRHARAATRCDVALSAERGLIVLRIVDDGGAPDEIRAGNGLTGMRERVGALGGSLVVQGGRGLALELSLPMGAGA
jgi:two-component system sensor histidine kinase DesK